MNLHEPAHAFDKLSMIIFIDRKIESPMLFQCKLLLELFVFFSVNVLAKFMIGFTQLEKGSAYGKVITKKKAE